MHGQQFFNELGNYAPVASGTPFHVMSGFDGVPGMTNPLIGMLGGGILQNIMNSVGMAPMGLHDRNAMDVLRSQQFQRQQQELLSDMAKTEEANYRRAFRGMAAVTGTPYGVEQRRAVDNLASFAAGASPLLAQLAPELLDQLGGTRGSSVVMANRMLMGGRYRTDPTTGELGMSTDSVRAMSENIYRDFYENGDIGEMRGISAGQLGGMFNAMQQRGMIATDPLSRRERTRDIVDEMYSMDSQKLREIAEAQGIDSGKLDPSTTLSMTTEQLGNFLMGDRIAELSPNLAQHREQLEQIRTEQATASRDNSSLIDTVKISESEYFKDRLAQRQLAEEEKARTLTEMQHDLALPNLPESAQGQESLDAKVAEAIADAQIDPRDELKAILEELKIGNRESEELASTLGIDSSLLQANEAKLSRLQAKEDDVMSQAKADIAEAWRRDPDKLRAVAAESGIEVPEQRGSSDLLSGEDIDKLALDDTVAAKLRAFDADRVKRSLKDYIGAIGAVRDVFGDAGRPNAPMQELIAGLERLTQGNVSRIDPGRLNMMVRTTNELANVTGVDIDTAMAMQNHAANKAQQLGIENVFGVHAMQGALAFGGAYRGMGNQAHTGWGRFNSDQMQQADMNLRVAAAASSAANQGSAALRLSDELGGFEEGTAAQAYVSALKAGMTEYVDPESGEARSIDLTGNQFREMFTNATLENGNSAGISENLLQSVLGQRYANRAKGEEYGTTNTFRRTQATSDVKPWIARKVRDVMRTRLMEAGIDRDKATEMAANMSGEVSEKIMSLPAATKASAQSLNPAVSEIMQSVVNMSEGGKEVNELLTEKGFDVDAFFDATATVFEGYATRSVRNNHGTKHLENFTNLLSLNDEETLNRAEGITLQAKTEGMLRDAMSPLGRGSVLRRTAQALMDTEVGDDKAFAKILSTAAGGVELSQIKDSLQAPMQKLNKLQQEYSEASKALTNAETQEEKSAAAATLESLLPQIKAQANSVAEIGQNLGIDQEDTLTDKDFIQTENVGNRLHKLLQNEDMDKVRKKGKFAEFWSSHSGDIFRETVDETFAASDALSSKALMSDASVRKLGLSGIRESNNINKHNQRLRELATMYTDGDESRLIAGDFKLDDKKLQRQVTDETGALLLERKNSVARLREMNKASGRQWGGSRGLSEMREALMSQGVDASIDELKAAQSIDDVTLGQIQQYKKDQAAFENTIKVYANGDYDRALAELDAGNKTIFGNMSDKKFQQLQERSKELSATRTSFAGDGMSYEERIAAADVLEDVSKLADPAREEFELPNATLVDRFTESFGVDMSEEERQRMSQMIDSPEGLSTLHTMLSRHKKLQDTANAVPDKDGLVGVDPGSPNTKLDQLMADYDTIGNWGGYSERSFKNKYKLESDEEFEEIGRAIKYERRTNLDQLGSTTLEGSNRTKFRGEDALDLYAKLLTGGKLADDGGPQEVRLANNKFELIGGNMTLDGDIQAEMVQAGKDDVRGRS